jgi:DNA mismatch repair protein MSH3
MAIAEATLEHLVRNIRCKTLFITHYPTLAASIQRKFPNDATNVHMAFSEEVGIDGIRTITFLYALTEGISPGSYGIECARLAGLPERLLEAANEKAEILQKQVASRSRINLCVPKKC